MALVLKRTMRADRDDLYNLLVLTLPDGREIRVQLFPSKTDLGCRVLIDAPPDVQIDRGEVHEKWKRERQQARKPAVIRGPVPAPPPPPPGFELAAFMVITRRYETPAGTIDEVNDTIRTRAAAGDDAERLTAAALLAADERYGVRCEWCPGLGRWGRWELDPTNPDSVTAAGVRLLPARA